MKDDSITNINGMRMKNIIYYVASSLDGYIAGKNDDISQFILQGEGG